MGRLPHDFVQCPVCTHVWNRSFVYDAVPYRDQPNLMFNAGIIWRAHLAESRRLAASILPEIPSVVEIGCGEGHFLRGLAELFEGRGAFVGFDPSASPKTGVDVDIHRRLFTPLVDMAEFSPDLILARHVLEHLTDPACLVEEMAWGAAQLERDCWLFVEAPCIDRVFSTGRLADFFYEHVSHFTTQSFRTLLERAGEVVRLEHGYDGEVIYALVRLGPPGPVRARAVEASAFSDQAARFRDQIRAQVDEIAASGRRTVIWGGTGKAAAFIHQFGLDAARFPWVVDSDPLKVGGFVPGTGQEICSRELLRGAATDLVIIPTQWRAKDVVAEMAQAGLSAGQILIEHNGRLVDFARDDHPYR